MIDSRSRFIRARCVQIIFASAVFASSVSSSGHAYAQTADLWTSARSPELAEQLAACGRAEILILQADLVGLSSAPARGLLRLALAELRGARAQFSRDVRPRILLGRVLQMLEEDRAALELLEAAIEQDPGHSTVVEAHFAAAISCARLGKPEREAAHYEALLLRETSTHNRATALTNQAEAFMLMGDVDRAVDGYRAALELVPDAALSHWGLAVALDRSGDPQGAIEEARLALTTDPDSRQLMSPNVFFLPAYDRYWYLALGAMSRAYRADNSELRVQWWNWSVQMWTQYVEAAASSDRWLALARAHRETCQRELRKVQGPGVRKGK